MSYTVKKENGTYDILEKNTDVLIELKCSEDRARQLCRKLNLGSGFNGWTPTFFATKMSVVTEEA